MAEIDFHRDPYGDDVQCASAVFRSMKENVGNVEIVKKGLHWIYCRANDGKEAKQKLLDAGVMDVIQLVKSEFKDNAMMAKHVDRALSYLG